MSLSQLVSPIISSQSAYVTCGKSSLAYPCAHLHSSIKLHSREIDHPIFKSSYANLISCYDAYEAGNLTNEQSYLLYLAFLNSTGLIEWRTGAIQTMHTQSIIAQTLPALVSICDALVTSSSNVRKIHSLQLPICAISPETANLSNCKYWISTWEQCFDDYDTGYDRIDANQRLIAKTESLENMLRNRQHNNNDKAAGMLAEWASLACNFAGIDCIIADGEHEDAPISLALYWKRIIRQCASKASIYDIHTADLDECLDHCEDALAEHDSFAADTLITTLRTALKQKAQFYSEGDIDITEAGTLYKILSPSDSVEDAAKQVLIDTAPLVAPVLRDYPSKYQYLKALTKYQMHIAYAESDNIRASQSLMLSSPISLPASIGA